MIVAALFLLMRSSVAQLSMQMSRGCRTPFLGTTDFWCTFPSGRSAGQVCSSMHCRDLLLPLLLQTGEETETVMGSFLLCGEGQLHDLHSKLVLQHPRGTANQLHKCARACPALFPWLSCVPFSSWKPASQRPAQVLDQPHGAAVKVCPWGERACNAKGGMLMSAGSCS